MSTTRAWPASGAPRGRIETTLLSRIDLGVGLGLGVDWFPLQRISVGGRTGLSMSYGFGESSRS